MTDQRVTGLLLAAGGGSRMGMPKALVRGDDDVLWVVRGVKLLMAAGCSPVVVVLGARAAEVEALLEAEFGLRSAVVVAHAEDWASGMAASLRAGLAAAAAAHEQSPSAGVLVTLVDLPDLTIGALARVVERAQSTDSPDAALLRATYGEHPGHPVFIGRQHWAAVSADVTGDAGAGRYLNAHHVESVDCGDLGGGDDHDTAP